MKKLLSVAVLLALVCALMPVHAFAGLRGVWDPITNGGPFNTGIANGAEQPALRPGVTFTTGGHSGIEMHFAFTTRSTVVGSETVRSIWLARNQDQIGFRVADLNDARMQLLGDPAAVVSYLDPDWDPTGKYLVYVESDAALTKSAIKVQQFTHNSTIPGSVTPVGAPLTVVAAVPGVLNRNPSWNPAGGGIAYASNVAGPSLDIYTVDVDPVAMTVGVPTRETFDDTSAEQAPAWGPNNKIAYATNKFGRNVLEIVDLNTPSPHATYLAETNFANISHNNPSWSPNGASIYYDAPSNEDVNNNSDIWVLDLANQSKCDIFLDVRGDADPDVSLRTNTTLDGVSYNTFLCSSQAANFGLCVWRGTRVSCAPPLAIGVDVSPTTLNLGSNGQNLAVTVTMPPETNAAGYAAQVDVPDHGGGIPAGFEGVKNRNSIITSPTFLGVTAPTSSINGSPFASVDNNSPAQVSNMSFTMNMSRKTVEARLVALGLVNELVPCHVTAYSNSRGRQFSGYGYLRIAANNLAGQAVRMEQNAPNPFNPVTKIRFAVAKAGQVSVRIYNVRGQLVKTVASGYYGMGSHEATWDGRTETGAKASSGVYFAKASARDDKGAEITSDVVKMVMAK